MSTIAKSQSSSFHCTAEWHLQKLNSRFAPVLYFWAGRLSAKSESFFPSVDNIAQYFSVHRTTVFRALDELIFYEWFEIIHNEPGKPVVYRVRSHKELVSEGRLECVQKETFPWTGEGDRLGQNLYATSGGRVMFYPRQMQGLRNSGLDDTRIIQEFRIFLDRNPQKGPDWKRVYYVFHAHLLHLADSLRSAGGGNSRSRVSLSSDSSESHRCDTPRCEEATPARRTSATQVFELSSDVVKSGKLTIPATLTRERPIVVRTQKRMEGAPPVPSHPPKAGAPLRKTLWPWPSNGNQSVMGEN
jgi:hypothetical protein